MGENDRGEITGIINHGEIIKHAELYDKVLMVGRVLKEICIKKGGFAFNEQLTLEGNESMQMIAAAFLELAIPPVNQYWPLVAADISSSRLKPEFKDQVDEILRLRSIRKILTGSPDGELSRREKIEKDFQSNRFMDGLSVN